MSNLAEEVESMSAFKRDSASVAARLKKSGKPIVLTVNGKAELVVQDAAAYRRLQERAALAETVEMVAFLAERGRHRARRHAARRGVRPIAGPSVVNRQVVITREAAREVDRRYRDLAAKSQPSANRWQANLLKAIDSLRSNAERCPQAPESEWYGDGLREHYFGKRLHTYRVIFEIRAGIVYILRVRHGRQDFLGSDDLPPPHLA